MIFFKEFDNGNILNIDFINKDSNWIYGERMLEKKIQRVNIFYNYYKDIFEDRHNEILFCLNKLLNNRNIDKIYVLCSDELFLENEKLIKIDFNEKFPKFKDFFNIINFISNESDINIILNSDCYIDEENIKLIKDNIHLDESYLLSRWEILNLNPFRIEHFNIIHKDESGCSQDAWVFMGVPKSKLGGDFHFGKAGCDNAIAYEFEQSGYNVFNPSKSIKIYHYHQTEKRTYGDYVEREQHRIQSPYLFIPSKTLREIKYKKISFYNHLHNGDIHYSREFIKDIMRKYESDEFRYYFSLNEKIWNPTNVLEDIKNLKVLDIGELPEKLEMNDSTVTFDGDNIYINTWVGQNNQIYVNQYGINLKSNYEIYKNVYEKLKIKIEPMEYYIPQIDYSAFNIGGIDEFIKNNKNIFKVLISNGNVFSAQSDNFSFDPIIKILSNKYFDVIFITTNETEIKNKNIFSASEIRKKEKNLNEISYLSTFCDIIIGRASGAYAFCQVKENYSNENTTFIDFIKNKNIEWHIGNICNHIISSNFDENIVIEIISNEIEKKKKRKPRIAFSIILNGLHHMKHNDYGNSIPSIFDYWVIVEGASNNSGSTSWCNKIPKKYHKNGKSIDGTIEYIKLLKNKHKNIIFVESDGIWNSKDDMVNKAIEEIEKLTDECFLWEIDIDEQWDKEQIINSEKELVYLGGKTGEFNVYQFVGENLIAVGKHWAGTPFIRLWIWEKGDRFSSHEPPVLSENKNKVLLSEKMKHYSFYFENDVKFKDLWYKDHQGSYEKWLELKNETDLPKHITYLFPNFKDRYANASELDSWIVEYDKYITEEEKNKKNKFESKPTIIESSKNRNNFFSSRPIVPKSNKEICDEFLSGYQPFQIFYNNSLMFDSTSTDKRNLSFFEDGFSLYGRMFSYQGMRIMMK